ncbi:MULTISPECIES: HD-GYP domain-containing protein [Clostridia]|jgi:HD-GYP domain-containing protein (c-di-GMP phosphodiesterase class II)|uniref:Phosphohydrolase n=1 Tax=Butyribacter intestini TaxID=1703332 RepID=A0AAW3JTJ8_9FIRM|nr:MULTISPECIES: HD domain-containing phosphohydrolase [Clostridia]KQC86131.1 phosphohydrolase [Butyribacter intestini]RHP25761.1 HD domain-containing protein [Clostridium sp. AF34-13]RHT91168.1 HD domain-containing protein [Clostridium sp. AM27-31LB]RHU77240.1 HD domain-containing protein [Butyribacter intestini]
MEIDIIGLLSAFSFALDCVEAELIHVTSNHGKRVAYMSVCMAEKMGVSDDALRDLAACALLHDNALTQYINEEFYSDISNIDTLKVSSDDITPRQLGMHCIYGEKNLEKYPFKTGVKDVILYHHEEADGSGPFEKKWTEVPLFARIIHFSDMLDAFCKAQKFDEDVFNKAVHFIEKNKDKRFDSEVTKMFFDAFDKEEFSRLGDEHIEEYFWEKVPCEKSFYSFNVLKDLADLFAKIIDYKSEFTSRHSLGVARTASKISEIMGYDKVICDKMYLAGTLHDVGKIAIGNEILEKPARLTDEEFAKMKNHAGYTYMILSKVDGFEEIRDIAAFHHERLDGSGYPFGKRADELTTLQRIMACADIYQALTEKRPYKDGMDHDKACEILKDMADKNWIDKNITEVICHTKEL